MNHDNKIIGFNEVSFKEDDESLNIFLDKAQIKAQGIRLNILRKFVGENLKDFGYKTDIEPGMLGRYERGTTVIHQPAIFKICKSLLEKYGVFVDPNWIFKGEGYGPHLIKENTKVKLKNIQEWVNKAKEYYKEENNVLNINENQDDDNMFLGKYLTMGSLVDLNNEEELNQLEYLDVVLTFKKANPICQKDVILAKISYDIENKKFIVNNKNFNKNPFFVEKDEIKSIKIINTLIKYNNENISLV
jgi:transcriptional regulator with XRE-family HTH domain